jgi:hypothetical protein
MSLHYPSNETSATDPVDADQFTVYCLFPYSWKRLNPLQCRGSWLLSPPKCCSLHRCPYTCAHRWRLKPRPRKCTLISSRTGRRIHSTGTCTYTHSSCRLASYCN